MNVTPRADLLRPTGMNQPPILGLNGPSFLQNTSQAGPQSAMGLPPNAGGGPMGMLPGGVSNTNPGMVGRGYPMPPNSMMPQGAHRIPMRPGQGGPPLMNGPGGSVQGNPHMGSPNNHQLNNMNFPSGMMPPGGSGPMRRAVSQPQPQNGMGHVGGIPPGVNGGMGIGMGMTTSASIPPQMRPPQHPQGPGHGTMRHMQSDMAMSMAGRPAAGGNMGGGNMGNVSRTMPIMGSLGQPPNGSSGMSGGMPHQNNFQNNMSMGHQPPHSSSPRPGPGPHAPAHNPGMSMGAPGPSQPPINRTRMTPDNSNFMNFGNPSFPPSNPPAANRMPANNTYPVIPSTPPNSMNEMSQSMSGSMGNTPSGTPNRPTFMPTPAQQFESMQQNGDANFGTPFGTSRPGSIPNHPPQPSSQQSHHQSPHSSDMMNIYPPRPPSQPQNQQNQQNPTGRPPSSAGPSRTPRPSQQLPSHPPNTNPHQSGRIPPPQTGPNNVRPPSSGGVSHPPAIAPRPPNQHPPSSTEPSPTASSSPPSDPSQNQQPQSQPHPQHQPQPIPSTSAVSIPRAVPNTPALGHGVGLIRLLQFSGILANESKQKFQLSWWNDLIREYFTPKAVMRFTLWKDSQRNEAKPFEIGVPILPRFFLATTQSGVKSMTLTLDGARERLFAYGHAVVECVSAIWTYRYNNGYIVTLRGPLTVHVLLTAPPPPGPTGSTHTSAGSYLLKFEDFQFDALMHDKYIALDSIVGQRIMESPRGLPFLGDMMPQPMDDDEKKWEEPKVMIERGFFPGEPVNAFGIPQATMRCLELAESVASMQDLIGYSCEMNLGPKESLIKLTNKIRDSLPFQIPASLQQSILHNNGAYPPGYPAFGNMASYPPNAISLYTSAPYSVTNPNPNSAPSQTATGATPSTMTSSMSSPQNAPASANSSPRKGHKTIPGQGQQPPPGGPGPSAGPGAATATTPVNANASTTPNPANASIPNPNANPNGNPNANPNSGSVSASTPGSSSTTNTPALAHAPLKRKQVPESPAQANADSQPSAKRTRKRGRTNA
ncbi:hypothetical protein D9758_007511 [Tetrapyrgos nigripes]|uniref:LIM-domain binding protein-domain-containing protein n=1 Tax=Tetrapyrgos nigripes TaxID=182062 RepID=A0A8H5LHV9_9AGAR|nr:hypothetical protein D9758_007511 [Tetrapyrgos nigripes]